MTGLDLFALIVLLVLSAAALAGGIARSRNHPQADAIAVCGWWAC